MIDLKIDNESMTTSCGCSLGRLGDENEIELYEALRFAMLNRRKFLMWYRKEKR